MDADNHYITYELINSNHYDFFVKSTCNQLFPPT